MVSEIEGKQSRNPNIETRRQSKVERIIKEYDLGNIGDELERYWTDNSSERRSLRELAKEFNCQILEAALDDVRMDSVYGDVENLYDLLTDDDVSTGIRVQAETSLERNGIDLTKLEQDFVSHQAIHTYLTKHRGIEPPSNSPPQNHIENTENTVQRLKGRLTAVAEKRLHSLRSAGIITLGTFSVLIDIRVVCEDCNSHNSISTILNDGGCNCKLNE